MITRDANTKEVARFIKNAEKQFNKLFPELKGKYKSKTIYPSDWTGGRIK